MRIAIAILLLALAAPAATLYEKDGIILDGTVRLVSSGAATCQVLAANESPESYEGMKANHGQPLHVWRLDFAARNRSGRRLEHLTAHFKIASEWPPCTNWTGPEGTYPETPQWAGSFEVLQRPSGMEPGDQVTDTVFVLAFHSHEPRFENWQVDYRFAAGSPAPPAGAGTGRRSAGSEGGAGRPVGQLPPDIVADRYLLQVEQAARGGDPAAARTAMERLHALQQEHELEPAAEDHFRYAQAWEAAGEPERAMESAVRYLQLRGRDAEHYTEALELLNRAESGKPGVVGGAAAAGRTGPAAPAGTSAAQVPRPGEVRVFDGMQFAWVPAGEFVMGSTSAEAFLGEQPLTRVRISRGFWMGRYEVTQAEWQAVMGTNPSEFSGCRNCPVESLSWEDAQAFLGRLNARDGRGRYGLPTEAEWEYAARAGTAGERYGDLDAIAWYGENSGDRTHPVGQKMANAWGLHDMLGNVSEWVQDWYGSLPGGSVTDPSSTASDDVRRVHRGGSWWISASFCRAPARSGYPPGGRDDWRGFRLLRTE